ncbi:MAG TPA: ABC transporter permease [Vicinamibacterales bacterium]|jgi:rhamnose transport system permease protein|nr:ABC transporter permease [Vicinamibacterales bacterium]
MMRRREITIGLVIVALYAVLAVVAPAFFTRENFGDLFLGNFPVLLVAIGTTIVILTGEIDISVGSMFAVCGVVAGAAAVAGLPLPVVAAIACGAGAGLGAINGALVAYAGLPSIVVTLATMVVLRDGLRWATQGAWIQNLPASFQWLGMSQAAFPIAAAVLVAAVQIALSWSATHVAAFRSLYATGSDPQAARLAGIDTRLVRFAALAAGGTLTGLAALLNAVRFNQIPSNAGLGLEMKVVAAVVVGGAAVRGGRGSFTGTLLGVVLLGSVGPALVFLGITSYWERAIEGAIVLAAVAADAWRMRRPVAITRRTAGIA